MPTKQGPTFQSIIHDLKSRKFSPIYVLMGDESYYIDQISDYVATHVLSPEERDFNQTVCFGSDVNAIQVTDMARRYPMMSEYQVIIVKEAQNIRSLDALEKYLKNPVKSTILVWCHKNGKIDARKKVVGLAQTVGVVFESQKLRDYQLPEFIQNYLKQKKVSIDPKSCQMIADHIGADLNRLTSELDKVLISLPSDNLRVTPEIVEEQIGVSKDFNAFELRNAIVQRDVFKANQIIKYFDNNPKAGSLYSFLPLLFSYFQNLMIAYYAPQKNTEQGIATALDLRSSWGAKDFLIGLKNYSARKTMDIISKIRDTDAKSKGLDNPNTGVGDLMKELIFFILH
ncbi:DNA polymerase III subunit delta [Prevotella histicola]|uniref:DNA polymerase III subunit delta n=1 Tax=Prevotella histicola TaxID=470565 RepID=UPI001C5FF5B8|nr:DNA polymerase III subunit delta [Prevotella histicola]MBW4711144.1 DNA polymerase III subunit delta [Prevotella histicola]MBW4775094.1 DNA polymerase III subunit delta [Prevotella histicola]MBW4875594.1 DNA polymerase III subunit delta [Prevotella histicola]MBW4919942.1 DNA polymerase III subunit delta [Prevotella histicola]